MSVDILGTNYDHCRSTVQCCFTSTETVKLIGKPRTATSTFTHCKVVKVDFPFLSTLQTVGVVVVPGLVAACMATERRDGTGEHVRWGLAPLPSLHSFLQIRIRLRLRGQHWFASPLLGQVVLSFVHCCFRSTETARTGSLWTSTSTFTQLKSSVALIQP